jgi:UDP-N-acetyl-D-mannosaminuronate dehydrogenase
MNKEKTVLVVGLGEVGKPLLAILSNYYRVIGIDIAPPTERIDHVDVMHICYPFQIRDFVGETGKCIERYNPDLTIINSTVEVGTTRKVAEWTSTDVVHSPVRGKHARMQEEMLSYTKFIGALNPEAEEKAARHFESAGFKTRTLASPEATELGKLAETTYFGVMIAWAQELERYCDQVGADYNEVISLYDEVRFFPQVKYVPGVIGGHCVMPNISILCDLAPSPLLSAIQNSNERKLIRDTRTENEITTTDSLSSASQQLTR